MPINHCPGCWESMWTFPPTTWTFIAAHVSKLQQIRCRSRSSHGRQGGSGAKVILTQARAGYQSTHSTHNQVKKDTFVTICITQNTRNFCKLCVTWSNNNRATPSSVWTSNYTYIIYIFKPQQKQRKIFLSQESECCFVYRVIFILLQSINK